MRFLIPRFSLVQGVWMLVFGLVGALIAGGYGVLHDQVTFGLGPEYFTRFKVYQFGYEGVANPGRWVAAQIGFQASWWVGLFAGWFLGRVAIPRVALGRAVRLSFLGVGLMLGVTLVFGFGGWLWAQWRLDVAGVAQWTEAMRGFDVVDVRAFATVGYIHNASYLGALVGLIGAVVWVWRRCLGMRG